MAMLGPSADQVMRMHQEIEFGTRQLELEKRRLQRLDRDLAALRGSTKTRCGKVPPRAATPTIGGQPQCPSRSSGAGSLRPTSAAPGSRPGSRDRRPPSRGPIPSGISCDASGAITERGPVSAPLKVLMHRLEVEKRKLDGINHENAALRKEIDEIRRMRLQCNGIFDKLRDDIKLRSEQLQVFVQETTASSNVCEDAKHRVELLDKRREAERNEVNKKLCNLRKELRNTDFEKKKLEISLRKKDAGVQRKRALTLAEEEEGFSEGVMMRRIMKCAFLNCIQRRHIKRHQKSIEVFEQAFATIKLSTGIEHIEDIVKIFVNLESSNFSLLTYVNHMNREIEALEFLRRARRIREQERVAREQRNEKIRNEALEDARKELQATEASISEGRASCERLADLIEDLRPFFATITERLEGEVNKIKAAGASCPIDPVPRPAYQLNEDNLPEWLEWVEHSLGKYRDLLPCDGTVKGSIFPCTAAAQVKALPVKKPLPTHSLAPLVKAQELPTTAAPLPVDEHSSPAQKRAAAIRNQELMDEESEEEEFGERPLKAHELRTRAEQSALRRKRRLQGGRRSDDVMDTTPKSTMGPQSSMSTRPDSTSPQCATLVTQGADQSERDVLRDAMRTRSSAADEVRCGSSPSAEISEHPDRAPSRMGGDAGRSDWSLSADVCERPDRAPPKLGDGILRSASDLSADICEHADRGPSRSAGDAVRSVYSPSAESAELYARPQSRLGRDNDDDLEQSIESSSRGSSPVPPRPDSALPPRPPSRARGHRVGVTWSESPLHGKFQLVEVPCEQEDLDDLFQGHAEMTTDELVALARRMGITLGQLCFVKQSFDRIDSERSGYIGSQEVKDLLRSLCKSLTDEEVNAATLDLDLGAVERVDFSQFADCLAALE